jgi:hypothetical protein
MFSMPDFKVTFDDGQPELVRVFVPVQIPFSGGLQTW